MLYYFVNRRKWNKNFQSSHTGTHPSIIEVYSNLRLSSNYSLTSVFKNGVAKNGFGLGRYWVLLLYSYY